MEKYYIPLLFLAVAALALFTKFGLKGGPGLGFVNNQATQSANVKFPTANKTDSWKTYSNQHYRFVLKHPLEWVSQEKDGQIFFGPSETYNKVIELTVYDRKNSSVDSVLNSVKPYKLADEQSKNVTVDNATGIEVTGGDQGVRVSYVVFETRDYIFETHTSGDYNIQVLDQILSTFKFL